jgi:hypothetical protein
VAEFPLLAIGLAPVVIGLALLISLPNPVLSSLGRLSLVFTLAILAPTNPQSYDPNVFLITCTLACLAVILTFAAQIRVRPLSSNRRLELLLREARSDRSGLDVPRHRPLTSEEAAYHDATRVQQIAAAGGAYADSNPKMMWLPALRSIQSAARSVPGNHAFCPNARLRAASNELNIFEIVR